ncbi:MAG TPA: glycoside hydrolase family 15 protein [Acetobacteraceae bacterium]|nr:glycoside hydrolase family 15 protein [Acetobacteraceae bacterium]
MPGLDLAVIGNCTVASLLTPAGRHVWFCFPRFDGDPVFHSLLGGRIPDRGLMDVSLRDQAGAQQRYLDNTAVVETLLTDSVGGSIRILDFCPRFRRYGRIFRPPMIVRRIEPLAGRPRTTVRIRPGFDYGSIVPSISVGSNHVRFVGEHTVLRLTTDMSLSYLVHETDMVLDRPVNLFLAPDEPIPENPDTLAREFRDETVQYWREWVRGLSVPFDWQDEVVRAAITLKLCSYDDTGGIVAALTSSIPEAPGSGRNWDYRFCWPRDSWFTVTALNRLSATRTMEGFMRYLLDTVLRERGHEIAPLYPVGPGYSLEERVARGLTGFGGEQPVRVGNAAVNQRQNDVYGAIVLTATQMFWDRRLPQLGDRTLYDELRPVATIAERIALEPDAGLWEYRGRARCHTFSAAMCWAALHRLGRIALLLGITEDAAQWFNRAEKLRQCVLARSANGGSISGALDCDVLDASVLLLPEIGLISSHDPRFLATVAKVEKRLVRNGFVMRYDEADDFGEPETAFVVCTFWYIDALAATDRRKEALSLFENVLRHRNHVGLLSEDIDPRTGLLWGNFPQTYSQVGLILSAMRLSRSWEEGLRDSP